MQTVKKKLGIKSVHKPDDWYWTRNPDAYAEDESDDDSDRTNEDEIPVLFLEDAEKRMKAPFKRSFPAPSNAVTRPSVFGELTLIDWRASV
jgi:hypothetical protein